MWTLKSKSVRRISKEEVPKDSQGNKQWGRMSQLLLDFTLVNGQEEIGYQTFVTTKDEVRNTINQHLTKLNEQEDILKEMADDTFELEPVQEVQEDPEVQAKVALQEAVADAKEMKEYEDIAKTDNTVKAKLDAFKALKK